VSASPWITARPLADACVTPSRTRSRCRDREPRQFEAGSPAARRHASRRQARRFRTRTIAATRPDESTRDATLRGTRLRPCRQSRRWAHRIWRLDQAHARRQRYREAERPTIPNSSGLVEQEQRMAFIGHDHRRDDTRAMPALSACTMAREFRGREQPVQVNEIKQTRRRALEGIGRARRHSRRQIK